MTKKIVFVLAICIQQAYAETASSQISEYIFDFSENKKLAVSEQDLSSIGMLEKYVSFHSSALKQVNQIAMVPIDEEFLIPFEDVKLCADIVVLLRTVEVLNEKKHIEIILTELKPRLPVDMPSMERLLVHAGAIALAALPTRVLLTHYLTRTTDNDVVLFLKKEVMPINLHQELLKTWGLLKKVPRNGPMHSRKVMP